VLHGASAVMQNTESYMVQKFVLRFVILNSARSPPSKRSKYVPPPSLLPFQVTSLTVLLHVGSAVMMILFASFLSVVQHQVGQLSSHEGGFVTEKHMGEELVIHSNTYGDDWHPRTEQLPDGKLVTMGEAAALFAVPVQHPATMKADINLNSLTMFF
jgi:hypothetical protein